MLLVVLLVPHSCGFAGCCLIRLTVGIHHYPDIQNIKDNGIRVSVERACLQLGQQMLLLRAEYTQQYSSTATSSTVTSSTSSHAGFVADFEAADGGCSSVSGLSMELLQQLLREACGDWLKL